MEEQKPLVTPWRAGKDEDKDAAKLGRTLLRDTPEDSILVKYKGEKWDLIELVHSLSFAIEELTENQCIPSAKCLFEGQQYMDDKYVEKAYYDEDH